MQKDEKYLCKSLQSCEKVLSLHHRSNEAEGKTATKWQKEKAYSRSAEPTKAEYS